MNDAEIDAILLVIAGGEAADVILDRYEILIKLLCDRGGEEAMTAMRQAADAIRAMQAADLGYRAMHTPGLPATLTQPRPRQGAARDEFAATYLRRRLIRRMVTDGR